jgi:hypothetical protein
MRRNVPIIPCLFKLSNVFTKFKIDSKHNAHVPITILFLSYKMNFPFLRDYVPYFSNHFFLNWNRAFLLIYSYKMTAK